MINKVVLEGRLTKDLDLKKTQSGLSVVTFDLAVNRGKDKDGKDMVDFPRIVVWRNNAEFLSKYASKGSLVSVDGRVATRNYEQDGKKVYITEIVADSVNILANPSNNAQYTSYEEEEIPF